MVHLEVIQGGAATDAELAEVQRMKPRTRGECKGQPGVCPVISCRHHLLTDVGKDGRIRLNGVKRGYKASSGELDDDAIVDRLLEMKHTCALDAIDASKADPMRLDDVADLMGLTRQRADQVIRASGDKLAEGFTEYFGSRKEPRFDLMRICYKRRDAKD